MEKFDWGEEDAVGGDGERKSMEVRGSGGGEEEDLSWNKSSFKRFDWDEGLEDMTWSTNDRHRLEKYLCSLEIYRFAKIDDRLDDDEGH